MPEIKQPEQLSLGLEDTRKGLFINMEAFDHAVRILRVNAVPLGGQDMPRAPQPVGRREQRVNHWYMMPAINLEEFLRPPANIEIHVDQAPENP